ncbi:M28 family peptidase [Xanthomarina sp. F2636L]|uniref:M28 family peptidase n=1 Tax=Xanthomarina sp. F2636L TaxID=2996018 RepID=UPI00225E0EA1|nr:M28 family peptidase [Xanthomarina sp. F2636L]MCX7549818.1 M20/M25/M40 family metallo-hydrolase [Xanthomarina sp. F2636L]
MKLQSLFFSLFFVGFLFNGYSQVTSKEVMLEKIKNEGFKNSQAMSMLGELSDVYGQRLTGSNEYLAAATWMSDKMTSLGLQNVHFESYCEECRGWSMESFHVEMVSPNYMHISAYPLAMTKSTPGIVTGDVVHIKSNKSLDSLKLEFSGKLKDKIVLLGKIPSKKSLNDTLFKRYNENDLNKMAQLDSAMVKQTPLPELFKSWETSDVREEAFLKFLDEEGALAVLMSRSMYLGVLHPDGTYFYKNGQLKPLPYFTIMPEHFGRLARMIDLNVIPKIRLNLETSFYSNPENNVNVIAELTGTDKKLKSETILVGAHFDSWHAGTGATDNGANSIVLVEALRILKSIGYQPKRTIKIGLWGGEEQAFLGSAAFAKNHYGILGEKPNIASTKVSAYLNLDNGAGAIRGLYLQDNALAKPVFKEVFSSISDITEGILTIENTLSTDHETFDHYNIPAFQFIQDPLDYNSVTHHSEMDLLEYVPEQDVIKNAVIMAWTIYSLSENKEKVPRKIKN